MIRINLSSLAPPKTKRGGKRAAVAVSSGGGEGSGTVVLALVFLVALGVAIGASYVLVKNEQARLEKELQVTLAENRRLADVKNQYEASKRKADAFERRVKIIDDLKEAQKGPVTTLQLVADTVNKTDAVWLESMTSDGKTLTFIGTALSADAVADLMANLRKTGAFKSVEIKETAQDAAIKEVQAFKFELNCEIGFSSKVQKQS
ncbi:MAG TPA: PilN domain-containing protein [Candidatus Angelobacter sp.]|nr:PilN domain-containing protein [Candidatus Angelobacter sp.]